jgi:hypothetical protein
VDEEAAQDLDHELIAPVEEAAHIDAQRVVDKVHLRRRR